MSSHGRHVDRAILSAVFKGVSIGVRPVLCGEALHKFASACAVHVATRNLALAVCDAKHSAGKPAGAALELAEL